MRSTGDDSEKGFNRVPVWDGRPDSFNHYIQEVKWFLAATKQADRPYAAARLIRRMLDSDYPALKTLMYKLDPSDFEDEQGITRLVQFLENSPMNRQPLPDAGAKLNQYYRRLNRKPNESIPQFLVREDHAYDGMWRALQRLLREKALDFSKYDVTEEDLKIFCGMDPNKSLYFGEDDGLEEEDVRSTRTENPHHDDDDPAKRTSSDAGSSGAPKAAKKGKDLIQRLMEKGLIPLAAMDIIRGWLILEMTSSTEMDKSLVKASTQNKLGYDAVRAALLSLHEDRSLSLTRQEGKGKGKWHHSNWVDGWDQEAHEGEDHDHFQSELWPHDEEWMNHDAYYDQEGDPIAEEEHGEEAEEPSAENSAMVAQLQEEESGLQAMLADTQRNLAQARQAVATAKRDRGWQGTSSNQSSMGTSRPTSTFMKGKNKGLKGKGFPSLTSSNSPMMWTSMKGSRFASQPFSKGYGKSKNHFSKGPGKNHWYQDMAYESGMLTLEAPLLDMHMVNEHPQGSSTLGLASSKHAEAGGSRGVIDTGATVSAGGQAAVQEMVQSLAKCRPDMQVTIIEGDRPYFRYGSGEWGRALFLVRITFADTVFHVYSLPSKNVPVLIGMRELKQLGVVINCANSKGIVAGFPIDLKVTSKGHATLDLACDIPYPSQSAPRSRHVHFAASDHHTTFATEHVTHAEFSVCEEMPGTFSESLQHEEQHDGNIFVDISDIFVGTMTDSQNVFSEYLQISAEEWQFLTSQFSPFPAQGTQVLASTSQQSELPEAEHGCQPGHCQHDQVSGKRSSGGREIQMVQGSEQRRKQPSSPRKQMQKQEEVGREDCVRRVSKDDSHKSVGPQVPQNSVAMHGQPCDQGVQQSPREMGRVRGMQPQGVLRPGCWSPCEHVQDRSWSQRQCSPREIEERRLDSRDLEMEHSEEHDKDRGSRARSQSPSAQVQDKGGEAEASRRLGDSIGPFSRGSPSDREGGEPGKWPNLEAQEDEWQEAHSVNLQLHDRQKILKNVQSNWEEFDSTHALRSLRDVTEPEHIWEICCSPCSRLTAEVRRQGMKSTRWNYETGFDLGNPKLVDDMIQTIPKSKPTRIWASPRCTAVTSIQFLNQRTDKQRSDLRRKRLRTIREIRQLIRIFKATYSRKPGQTHLYMEWPKSANFGWNLKEWNELQTWLYNKYGQRMYWTEIHGCMHGLVDSHGVPINKPWYVLTTDFDFYSQATLKCDGGHQHRQVVGMGTTAVHSTAFYPESMVRRIVQIWKKQWHHIKHAEVVRDLFVKSLHDEDNLNITNELDQLGSVFFL